MPALWWGFSSDDCFLVAIDWPRFAANPFIRNGRPIEMLPFALLPDRARVHHAVNLVIYLACLVLMWRLCRRLSFDAWSTFLALSAFFHPAFLWSATWIAQRNDLLVIAFVLAAMAATGTAARLACIAVASGAHTPFLFQNIVFAGEFANAKNALHADELRQMIEVRVSRVQCQGVLQDEGGEPHVVCRNRRALLPELAEHRGVMVGRVIVGEEHGHAVLEKEPPQGALVFHLPTAVREASPKLAEDDKGQQNRFRFLQ